MKIPKYGLGVATRCWSSQMVDSSFQHSVRRTPGVHSSVGPDLSRNSSKETSGMILFCIWACREETLIG